MRRIVTIPDGITFKDFRSKYRKFFLTSSEDKANALMAAEYTRLTGNPAIDYDQKPKKKKAAQVTKEEIVNSVKDAPELRDLKPFFDAMNETKSE